MGGGEGASSGAVLRTRSALRSRGVLLVLAVVALERAVAQGTTGETRLVLLNLVMLVVPGATALAMLLAARRQQGRVREHVIWLAVGVAAWAVGEAYWMTSEVLLHRVDPFPSWADAGYLMLYPPVVVALVLVPASRLHGTSRKRGLSDAVAVSASSLLLMWATVLHPVLDQVEHVGLVQAAVGLGYPSADVIVVSMVLMLLVWARRAWVPVLGLYAAAVSLLLVADGGFAYLTTRGTYATGSWIDLGWLVGFALLGLAVRRLPSDEAGAEAGVARASWLSQVVPFASYVVAGAVAVVTTVDGSMQKHVVLQLLMSVVFGTAIVRSITARGEGEAYARELLATTTRLERLRTSHDLAFDAAGMVALTWTATDRRWHLGDGADERLGVEVEGGFTTDELRQVTDDAGRTAMAEAFEALSPDHPGYDLELQVPTRRGWRHLRNRGVARFSADGELEELVGVLFDVTEHWESSQAEARREASRVALLALGARLPHCASLSEGLEDALATIAGLVGAPVLAVWHEGRLLAHWPHVEGAREEALGGGERACQFDIPVGGKEWGTLAIGCPGGVELPAESRALVESVVVLISLTVERLEAQEALWRGSRHDALTGLPNRVRLGEHLAAVLAAGEEHLAAVAYLDLDNFKVVNDRFGHPVGDTLLKTVAHRLVSCLRPGDMVARLGGDEFAIVMGGLPGVRTALDVTERVQTVLNEPVDLGPATVEPRASIGLATTAESGRHVADLLRNADMAMYVAKRLGSREAVVFEPRFHDEAREEGELADDLRGALLRGEMVIHYQPVVELASGRLCGAESLVRWQRPGHGLVPPADFLPVAARLGVMADLSAFVLTQACRWAATFQRLHPDHPFVVAVNVSPADVVRQGFPDLVTRILAETGLAPSGLSLEIVESGVLADLPAASAGLGALRATGVQVSIDDFGTGYASVTQLKGLPLDSVKIDRGFVDGLGTQLDDSALVAALVTMAHTLGLDVIAEGVETEVQRDALIALGCEMGQGFLFGAPVEVGPADFAVTALVVTEPADAARLSAVRPRTVVIADDLDDDRRILTRYLNRSGLFTVVGEAADGAGAVQLVRELHPEVALLDVSMPVLDGFEALSWIHSEAPETDVVMLTGFVTEATVQAARDRGACGCLAKGPFDVTPALTDLLEAGGHCARR